MKISTAFPSRFLRADDIDQMGGQLIHTIRKVVLEEVGQDRTQKPVVYFQQIRQGLVLNRSNAARLAASLGDETDAWTGQRVTLETEQVPMRGQLVNSIRVRVDGKFREERRPPMLKFLKEMFPLRAVLPTLVVTIMAIIVARLLEQAGVIGPRWDAVIVGGIAGATFAWLSKGADERG